MKKLPQLTWLIVIGLLAAAGCRGGTGPKAGPPGGSVATVDAVKLCDDYKAGESTADRNYKGKEVEVQGKIGSVRPDPKTKAKFVVLKGSDGGGTRQVRCYFTADQQPEVEKVKSGDTVKVKGTCTGKQGVSGDTFDVTLENCKLVK